MYFEEREKHRLNSDGTAKLGDVRGRPTTEVI